MSGAMLIKFYNSKLINEKWRANGRNKSDVAWVVRTGWTKNMDENVRSSILGIDIDILPPSHKGWLRFKTCLIKTCKRTRKTFAFSRGTHPSKKALNAPTAQHHCPSIHGHFSSTRYTPRHHQPLALSRNVEALTSSTLQKHSNSSDAVIAAGVYL
jgi:hypothetical protein